jgi:hypothetical protein
VEQLHDHIDHTVLFRLGLSGMWRLVVGIEKIGQLLRQLHHPRITSSRFSERWVGLDAFLHLIVAVAKAASKSLARQATLLHW